MNFQSIRSLKGQLILLSTLSGMVSLLVACVGFIGNDLQHFQHSRISLLQTQSDLAALFLTNSTASQSPAEARLVAAQHMLKSLLKQPNLATVALYDQTGLLVQSESQWSPNLNQQVASLRLDSTLPENDGTVCWQPLLGPTGARWGSLYLRSNATENLATTFQYWNLCVLICGFSLASAVLITFVLQRQVSEPITVLAKHVKEITEQKNYAVRIVTTSKDEVGELYSAINLMLQTVEASQQALEAAHTELEERVTERTEQLVSEIEQRKNTEQALVLSKEAAEAANLAKSSFLANMSHEIRTPLNAILGFTDLLRKETSFHESGERQEYLETIHRSGEHLLSLVSDILDLSKIEAGQLQVEQIRCSPYQIIAEVVSFLRVRAKEKGITLDYHWDGQIPESILTDSARLKQLLLNLVGNALKFTEVGGVHLLARLNPAVPRQLTIAVMDTGIGIPPEKQEQIFDPFSQADSSVTRRFGGTGLGLAICRRLTAALQGSIQVESEPGKGSTFTIQIDTGSLDGVLLHDGPSADLRRRPDSVAAPKAQVSLKGKTILVVDDGDTNRKLIQIVLARAGANVLTAENGAVALEIANSESLDLILMDMQMPVMDGYTASTQLRRRGFDLPIIALTAHAMSGDEAKCRDAGCSGYLTKPIDTDRLLEVVGNNLQSELPLLAESVAAEFFNSAEVHSLEPLYSELPMDDQDFREIVEEFIERAQHQQSLLLGAWKTQNLTELKSLVHWMKGSGGTAGFPLLTQIALRLEHVLQHQQMAAIEELLEELQAVIRRMAVPNLQEV